MLYSMTGYGRSEQLVGDKTILIELRSLNGKQFDLRLNIPSILKPFEFEVRNTLNEQLQRGSVECIVSIKQSGTSKPVTINTDLLKGYYKSVMAVATEVQADTSQILPALLRLPEVVVNSADALTDNEWKQFEKALLAAIQQLQQHRAEEGAVTEKDLLERITQIEQQQEQVKLLDPERRKTITENIKKQLEDTFGKENYDTNRLEQELIYYIEKIDISEEMVRLTNHCNYFKQVLHSKETAKGRKLSFVLQEIGREINTTGSKANNAAIQRSVVLMKDELEKAKEQVLNIL
jgi:uncharacterized protein (TIGR00255 family)